MALDKALLENALCKRLCAKIRVHERDDGVLMLDSPFTFPDGDHFPIYVTETGSGNVTLSDRGHTLMHMSYVVTLFGYERSLSYRNGHRNIVDTERADRPIPITPEECATSSGRFLYDALRKQNGIATSPAAAPSGCIAAYPAKWADHL